MLELTNDCNLACPICYAGSGHTKTTPWQGREDVRKGLQYLAEQARHANLLLSGGEPTLCNYLPEVIADGLSLGFSFFQLNTNGLRLAAEPGYGRRLREAGLATVFLQFDSMEDEACQIIRGRSLLQEKKQAIENCAEAGLGVVLVPTLLRGVNDQQIKGIIDYALSCAPVVRGVHLQPCSAFGRTLATMPGKITMPELLNLLTTYPDSPFQTEDFRPPGGHSLCALQGEFYLDQGRLVPRRQEATPCCCSKHNVVTKSAFIAGRWRGAPETGDGDSWTQMAEEIRSSTFTISAKLFQDWSDIDLKRLQNCSLHVLNRDFKRIPFCAWNLTSRSGQRLKTR